MTQTPDRQTQLGAWLGHPPHPLTGQAELAAAWIATPLGEMVCVTDPHRLHLLEFIERRALPRELRRLSKSAKGRIGLGHNALTDRVEAQLSAYFAGKTADFDLPLALHGTAFQKQVWHELMRLPAGAQISYSDLARRLDRFDATRAVAGANGANQIALVIPCHRVLGADGSLTGYGGGLWRKEALIRHERTAFAGRPA
ncbi:methylated-DNA--[protein]-cysteine S-methyltransferase [Paracoccus lutimaris]|uniref:methylated-DNA--[protein]-cysteine S-methyltransferase n=1 Tax=Paracoccus lutimaris TaxID=1490030 RepID=A0A368Z6M9_9RHOB|nr:methylated-DNA--[protein]-cysteine S-methyltransferase [Paracoccus lutimaris]RCW88115.1 methylated-DNA-[protein]-cysteine S-methyltransferase [Paracoccus lutimaris]